MKIINTKKVGDVYHPDGDPVEMDPFSDYVHHETQVQQSMNHHQSIATQQTSEEIRQTAKQNIENFFSGIDAVLDIVDEFQKRAKRTRRP